VSSNILIYRIGHLGDTIVSLPAISNIISSFQSSNIYLFTNKTNSDASAKNILNRLFVFKRVIEYSPNSRHSELLKIAKEIRTLKISNLYYLSPLRDPYQVIRDYVYFRLVCGIKTVFGLREAVKKTRNKGAVQKESDRLLSIVKNSGLSIKQVIPFVYPLNDKEKNFVSNFMRKIKRTGNEKLVAICPGSKMKSKRWPIENYFELGRRILNGKNVIILVVGDEHDKLIGEQLCKKWGVNCFNIAGHATIFETAEIMKQCLLYIGNDTGAMHLAASVGLPCLAVFSGRDNAGKWEPFGNNNIILRKNLDCSGCMLETCSKNNACLRSISVNEVFLAYQTMIKRINNG